MRTFWISWFCNVKLNGPQSGCRSMPCYMPCVPWPQSLPHARWHHSRKVHAVYITQLPSSEKNSLQPINNFFPRSLLSFAFLGWWLRLDIFRLGSIGCRCSFISFAVLALSGVAVLDVLVNLTFQHFVDVLLGHDFHAPGCRLRQKYFYGRSCHKKILWIITKGTSFLYWELSQEKNINHHQVTAPGLSLWPPWSLRPACRLWKSACRMQYILTRTPEWQAYNCGLKIYPLKGLFFFCEKKLWGPLLTFHLQAGHSSSNPFASNKCWHSARAMKQSSKESKSGFASITNLNWKIYKGKKIHWKSHDVA